MSGGVIADGMIEARILDDVVRDDISVDSSIVEDVSGCDVVIAGDICGCGELSDGLGVGGIRIGVDIR